MRLVLIPSVIAKWVGSRSCWWKIRFSGSLHPLHLQTQKRNWKHAFALLCIKQAHLKEHQTMHSSERPFLCHFCGSSFKTQSVQRKHILSLHLKPRAHPCSLCEKKFNTPYALRRHNRTHEMEAQKLAAAQGSTQETTLIQLGMSAEETAHLEQVRSGSFIWVVLMLLFCESLYMVLDHSSYCSSYKKADLWVSSRFKERERERK